MRYYIADNHFGHTNVIKMDGRNFSSTEEMDQYMIDQWNKKVRKNDEVVILGDFSWYSGEKTNEIVRQLKGKLHLIAGGHDKRFLRDKNFDASRFVWIKDYAEMNDNKRTVVLCHYPIFCYNGQFRRNQNGVPKTWMLHGHTHLTHDQNLVEQFKDITRNYPRVQKGSDSRSAPVQMINCFCMLSDYTPLTLDEWIEIENSGVIKKSLKPDWGKVSNYG